MVTAASGRFRRALVAGVALVSLAGSIPARAQDGDKDKKTEKWSFSSGPVLVVDHAALGTLFSDPKDKAMGDALAMIPARAAELPHEIPDMPPEAAGLIKSMLGVIARPGRLTIAYDETPTGGFFGYGLSLSVLTSGQEEAATLQKQILDLLEQADNVPPHKASSRFQGFREMQLPVGLIAFGPRKAADGWRYEIIAGTMQDPDVGAAALPAPMGGLDPFIRVRADLSGLTPAINTVQMFAGARPEIQEIRKELETYGIIGPKAMKVSYQAGQTKTETVSFLTIEGAGSVADAAGVSRAKLDRADLNAIPADAICASLGCSGGWVSKLIAKVKDKNEEVAGALDQFKQMTQVDLESDLLASLGDVSGFYTSESTGGGGLGSAVLMISVKDRAKLKEAISKLAEFGNTVAKNEARGYVRVAMSGGRDGADLFALHFPGLPVPLELTAALTDKWLLITPTPQAAIVAVAQAGAKEGLTGNAAFASAMPKDLAVSSIKFKDTARNMHKGYTLVAMLGAGVQNLVRSPSDPTRQPPLTVPTYPELKKGVKPEISWGMWKGNDFVVESHADHSMLVNTSAAGAGLAAMIPAMASVMSTAGQGMQQRMQNRPPPVQPRRPRHKEENESLISSAERAGAMLMSVYEAAQAVPSPEGVAAAIFSREASTRDGE
jgi:hypothetical protein